MINIPVYDAIQKKNRLHKRATHASAQSFPKAQFYGYSAGTWILMQAVVCEMAMLCPRFYITTSQIRNHLPNAIYNAHDRLMKLKHKPSNVMINRSECVG